MKPWPLSYRHYITGSLVIALLVLLGDNALAAGALAIDEAKGDQWGWAVDFPTYEEAEQQALQECGAGCSIVMRVSASCAAYAADQQTNSTAVGWSYGYSNAADARNRALAECKNRGGVGSSCIVRVWGCDTETTEPATTPGAGAAKQQKQADSNVEQYTGEMVAIPGGSFRMGDLSGWGISSEEPVHSVTVPAFRLGKHEVTFDQWDACVSDGGCGGYRPDDQGWGRSNRPVINVSWDDVQLYIDWLNGKTNGGYRLPSEAEWEYAARAGSATDYNWGNDLGTNRANCSNDYCGDSYQNTAPVGSFRTNAWGLHDMHGNVWEWVEDCWNGSYAGAPSDGSAWTRGDCGRRVIRGGSWGDLAAHLRSAERLGDTRAFRGLYTGFRLAQDN